MKVLRTISNRLEENPRKKTPTRCTALVIIILRCDLKDKLQSMLTPRSEELETLLTGTPSNTYWKEDLLRMDRT